MDISNDKTKFGFSFTEINRILISGELNKYKNITIKGFMGMASFTNDNSIIKEQFSSLNQLYEKFKTTYSFDYLSMGMSGDYLEAISKGSNMIRIGSDIFGKR